MRYFFISVLLHIFLIIIIFIGPENKKLKYASGSGSPKYEPIVSIKLESDIQGISSESNTKQEIIEKKIEPQQPLQPKPIEKKQQETKIIEKKTIENKIQIKENNKLLKEKAIKKTLKTNETETKAIKTQNKQKTNHNHSNEQAKYTQSTNKNANGNGKGMGIGQGVGNEQINGKGSGKHEETENKYAILQAQIHDRILENWFPPEEFAARNDIIITAQVNFNSNGEIIGYILKTTKNDTAHKQVIDSIKRALEFLKNDEELKNNIKKLQCQKINITFCPREVLG